MLNQQLVESYLDQQEPEDAVDSSKEPFNTSRKITRRMLLQTGVALGAGFFTSETSRRLGLFQDVLSLLNQKTTSAKIVSLSYAKLEQNIQMTPEQRMYAGYGNATYQYMMKNFRSNDGLLVEDYTLTNGNSSSLASLYSYSLYMSEENTRNLVYQGIYTDEVVAAVNGFENYWINREYSGYTVAPFGRITDNYKLYIDDAAWVLLEEERVRTLLQSLIQQNQRTVGYLLGTMNTYQVLQQQLLGRMKQVYRAWKDNWDVAEGGGLYWKEQVAWEQNHDRGATSNAPAGEVALHLYNEAIEQNMRDEAQGYLAMAKSIYEWMNQNLRGSNGLYYDFIRPGTSYRGDAYIYNAGAMIGLATMLADATRDKTYVTQAEEIATAALEFYQRPEVHYITVQPVRFVAVAFKNLLLLSSRTQNSSLKQGINTMLKTYADTVWNDGRFHNQEKGTFHLPDDKDPNSIYLHTYAPLAEIFWMAALDKKDYGKLV